MVKKLADNLFMETDIPFNNIVSFLFFWKTDCHAVLNMEGYMDRSSNWNQSQLYESQIKLWLENDGKAQIIFCGSVIMYETRLEGENKYFILKVISGSWMLDQKITSRSFQNVEKTYGEIARDSAESEGGHVIRNQEIDEKIGKPVVRYEETVWQFACRLAFQLGTCIIPDVVTGQPNFWFGMRKGQKVSFSSEEQYTIDMFPARNQGEMRYQIEDRAPYKIGDTVLYLKQKLTITEVEGRFERGELLFKYTLEDIAVRQANKCQNASNAGLGLWGTVQEVEGELIKIALDIDGGDSIGEYFYRWQPETGNSLYAMPEPGARALLYFYHSNQCDGAVIHCLNKETRNCNYKERSMYINDGDQIHLWKNEIGLFKGAAHSLTVEDRHISVITQKGIELSGGAIFFRGKRILLKSPETINISQG